MRVVGLVCLLLVGCDDAASDVSVTRDLAVPADLFAPKDLACLGGTFPRDCFTMPWCCAPCPQSGVYSPNDTCDIVGLQCEYETYAFQCGSDHHYHCIDYQATLCPDGGT